MNGFSSNSPKSYGRPRQTGTIYHVAIFQTRFDGTTVAMMTDIQKTPRLANFIHDEDGAVTVDWVVLSAAVVGLCSAIFFSLGNGAHDHAERIGDEFVARGIMTY